MPYRKLAPMPRESEPTPTKKQRKPWGFMTMLDYIDDRWGGTASFAFMMAFIFGLSTIVTIPIVWVTNRSDARDQAVTAQAASRWATAHHGKFEGCSEFNHQQACRVRVPAGPVTLLYMPGDTIPSLTHLNVE